jgi:hypothetical protein
MVVIKLHNSEHRYPFLLLVVFVAVAYIPVLVPFFHLKNDVITQNLPTRFYIGESLHSHSFPWWNPYMNFGIPQYADMNNGFWNPVLWFIAYFFNYSVLSITIEEIFYILIGGWGVYLLSKQVKNSPLASLLCSFSYVAGGFVLGHLQHFCWITGCGFFPYVLLFFLKAHKQSTLKYYLLGGISCFLFVSSTHPGLVIGSLYFFLFVIFYSFSQQRTKLERTRLAKTLLLFLLFAILFSPIVWICNLEGIFQITRGTRVDYGQSLNMPTTLGSYLSLLYPTAVNKGTFLTTDISMRNMSIGITGLVGVYIFFRFSIVKNKLLILLSLLFFVLLASGIPKIIFYHLPLLGFVRLNGEFSYFPFLASILLSGIGISISLQQESLRSWVNQSLNILLLVFGSSIIISLYFILFKTDITTTQLMPLGVKKIFEYLNFWHLLLLNGILQLTFVLFYKKYFFEKTLLLISALHLIILTWLGLPFTGIGQLPRSKVQNIINTVPRGIFKPYQKSIIENKYIDSSYNSLFLNVAFYSKQIGYPKELRYPVVLKSTEDFYNDSAVSNFITQQAYLFLTCDTLVDKKTNFDSTDIQVNYYSATHINSTVHNSSYKFLVFLQNNYPRWKAVVDGRPVRHYTVYKTFIGIPLSVGTHDVEFIFDVSSLKWLAFINIFVLLIGVTLLFHKRVRNVNLFFPENEISAT